MLAEHFSLYHLACESLRLIAETPPHRYVPFGNACHAMTRDELGMSLDDFSDQVLAPMLAACAGQPQYELPMNADAAQRVVDMGLGIAALTILRGNTLQVSISRMSNECSNLATSYVSKRSRPT